MRLGEMIAAERLLLKWDQKSFGAEVGAGQSLVSSWEAGQSWPKGRHIPRLAKILKVDEKWLAAQIILEKSERPPSSESPPDSDLKSRIAELEKKLESMASANVPQAMVEKGSKREELLTLIGTVPDSRLPALISVVNLFLGRSNNQAQMPTPTTVARTPRK